VTTGISLAAVLILLVFAAVVLGLPMVMLALCIRAFSRPRSALVRVMSLAGLGVCLLPLVAVGSYVAMMGPGRSAILTEGMSPSGQEYCVVQTFKDLLEPYQVSFYLRDTEGMWRWYYLEHEDSAWRSASVRFAGSKAIVSRNGKPFREVSIPTDPADATSVPAGYREQDCPANFSVQDVFAFHNERYQ
jgi:hypothetical protein